MFLTLLLTAAADLAPPPLPPITMERALLWNETNEPVVSEAILRRYQGQLKYCYRQQWTENPQLTGLVVLDWRIGEGRTLSAIAPTNTTENAALSECLIGKLEGWSYPDSIEGRMIISLTFRPGAD